MVDRDLRVAEELKKVLSEIIKTELKSKMDFFSIPYVQLSKDLNYAKVYVSFFMGNPEVQLEKINRAKGFIRTRVGSELKLRKVPELTFVADDSIKQGEVVLKKIKELDIPESKGESDE